MIGIGKTFTGLFVASSVLVIGLAIARHEPTYDAKGTFRTENLEVEATSALGTTATMNTALQPTFTMTSTAANATQWTLAANSGGQIFDLDPTVPDGTDDIGMRLFRHTVTTGHLHFALTPGNTASETVVLSGKDQSTFSRGMIVSSSSQATTPLTAENNNTSGTTNNSSILLVDSTSSTFNTTGSDLTEYALHVSQISNRSAGANNLTNVGGYFTASGGQTNQALVCDAGDVVLNNTSGTTTVKGAFTGTSTGSFGGALNMNSHLIDNVTDPSSAQDAATKNYVDSQVGTVVSSAWFGPGTDGNVHITAGTTTLTRDEYYDTITIDDGGIIDVAGFTLYAKTGIVGPATNVSGGAVIKLAQLAGNDGSAGSGGNTVACKSTDGTVGEGVNCTAAAGGFNVGAGGSSNNGATARWPTNYKAGEGGNGGAGATAAGTGSINSTTLSGLYNVGPVWGMIGRQPTSPGASPIRGGGCGGGGGGSPTGGGGSGGCGGGYVAVSAKTITNPSNVTIDASGTKGGNGFTTGNTGGGGGGGGGYAVLVYSTGLPTVIANGGAGGTGHNGGANGSNGFAGQVQILQVH